MNTISYKLKKLKFHIKMRNTGVPSKEEIEEMRAYEEEYEKYLAKKAEKAQVKLDSNILHYNNKIQELYEESEEHKISVQEKQQLLQQNKIEHEKEIAQINIKAKNLLKEKREQINSKNKEVRNNIKQCKNIDKAIKEEDLRYQNAAKGIKSSTDTEGKKIELEIKKLDHEKRLDTLKAEKAEILEQKSLDKKIRDEIHKIVQESNDLQRKHRKEIKAIENAAKKLEKEKARQEIIIKNEISKVQKAEELKIKKAELQKTKDEAAELKRQAKIKKQNEKLKELEKKTFAIERGKQKAEELKEAKITKEKAKRALDKYKDNPFLRGRAIMYHLFGSEIERTRKYYFTCLVLAFCLVLTVIGIIYIGSQSKIQPYSVKVGQKGEIIDVEAMTPADRQVKKQIIKYFLEQFIVNLRSVSGDNIVEKLNMARMYAAVNINGNSNALGIVKQYIEKNNPFKINSEYTKEVAIHSILPVSRNTYQITWGEITRTTGGKTVSSDTFTGQLTYKLDESYDENFKYNPFGIYVTDITMSQIAT